jgi:hypothetical protein
MTICLSHSFFVGVVIGKVVKIGPDRPVEPRTGPAFDSVGAQNRYAREPG